MTIWAHPTTNPVLLTDAVLTDVERVIEDLQRAWVRADDEEVEAARQRVETSMRGCGPQEREVYESALARLERARRQARLRHRTRH